MQVALLDELSEPSARRVKAKLERTRLGDIASAIAVELRPSGPCIAIDLDRKLISKLQLDVSAESVRQCILAAKKLKLKKEHVRCVAS